MSSISPVTQLFFFPEFIKKELCKKSFYSFSILAIFTASTILALAAANAIIKHTYHSITDCLSKDQKKVNEVVKTIILRDFSDKPINWKDDYLHVNILNHLGYFFNGKIVKLKEPKIPEKIIKPKDTLSDLIVELKNFANTANVTLKDPKDNPTPIKIKDITTDVAIYDSSLLNHSVIALNFANEQHVGGAPGIYRDSTTSKIVQSQRSATAQEESLVNKSTLFLSQTLLKTDMKVEGWKSGRIRNYYPDNGFDSQTTAYVSDDQLFGILSNNDFFTTKFLEKPCDVSFITSAAKCYGKGIPVAKDSEAYKDAQNRIRTHLFAAAKKAIKMKETDPEKPVELILGAFGCGAFAPSNQKEYAKMIANIYNEELSGFKIFFNIITFAIPKMGKTNPTDSFLINFNAFQKTLTQLS